MSALIGKRVFVTAGATGIGGALVRRFEDAGAQVAYCDMDADAVAAQTHGTGFVGDVTDEAAMADVFAQVEAKFGGIDVVCAVTRVAPGPDVVRRHVPHGDGRGD